PPPQHAIALLHHGRGERVMSSSATTTVDRFFPFPFPFPPFPPLRRAWTPFSPSVFHSSMVQLLLMDPLQLLQMGRRLWRLVAPPLLKGMLWPHSKAKVVIWFWHHTTAHLARNRSPQNCSHTCSRSAFGIARR